MLNTQVLTTKERVKARLGITNANWDSFLDTLINGASEYIETQCSRKFAKRSYTEIISIDSKRSRLFLSNFPVSTLTSLEYRIGTFADPQWTAYLADEYILEENGKNGVIQVAGSLPVGPNVIRVQYEAGYDIDFDNFGEAGHTLPSDITELCERMVVRWFKRREAEGKSQESRSEGANVTWKDTLGQVDMDTIQSYKRILFV